MMVDLNRREFMAATVAPVATAGCLGSSEDENTGLEKFYFDTDLEKAEVDVDGEDIYVNLYAHAEDSQEALQKMELQYMEPGEDVWKNLTTEEADAGEISATEPYSAEEPGDYRFRSVAHTEQASYASEVEVVEFVEEMGTDLF